MLGNDHFKPFPNIAKLLYHSHREKPEVEQLFYLIFRKIFIIINI